MNSSKVLEKLLRSVGVGVHGKHAHDLKVYNADFLWDVLPLGGTRALGEAYMYKHIDFVDIAQALEVLAKSWLGRFPNLDDARYFWGGFRTDPQSIESSAYAIRTHYDIPADVFRYILGPKTMMYTSAIGLDKNSKLTLDQGQALKNERLIGEIESLRQGDRILDVGFGYGTIMAALAQRGVRPVGVSLSTGQLEFARQRYQDSESELDLRLCDYRHFTERVDHIVSIEMIEAVGRRHLGEFFGHLRSLLTQDDGRLHYFVLQAITINRWWSSGRDNFLDKYIFPGGELARYKDLARAWGKHFTLVNSIEFGQSYAVTLQYWRKNLVLNRTKIVAHIGDVKYRMLEYYFALCEVSFKLNINTVGQYTLVAK